MLGVRNSVTLLGALACAAAPLLCRAYGSEAHLAVGMAAEPKLCAAARAKLDALGGNDGLPELGNWADAIRRERPESAPWHYVNIEDRESVRAFRHGPDGDVLEAIPRFSRILSDTSRPRRERAEALRFLVHFVVDIHQPLHVGRESDRGGNTIELVFEGEATNLHRFWDTNVIELENLLAAQYADVLRARMQTNAAAAAELDPLVWAEESFALRTTVYDFTIGPQGLDADYIERARDITRRRLAEAALRLAATLNGALGC